MRLIRDRWASKRRLTPEPVNLVAGLSYTMPTAPTNTAAQANRHLTNYVIPAGTAGSFGREDCHSWNNVASTMVFDLGEPTLVSRVGVYGIVNGGGGIRTPASISVDSSPDGSSWTTRASASLPTEVGTTWAWETEFASFVARYWRISQTPQSGLWTAVGEVQLFDI